MATPPWFPVQPPTQGKTNEILILGERYELPSTELDVRTYDQPGAYSFYSTDSPDGMPMFGFRYAKPGKKITTKDELFELVHQLIIHTDLTDDSAGCFRALVGRSLSSHFFIDWDGVLWQALDPIDCGYHAGEGNMFAMGLDFNNRLPNLEREPNEPPYRKEYSRIDEVDVRGKHKRPVSERMQINGAKVRSYGYTDPQYTALVELLKVLTKRFKNLKAQFPVDAKGEVINRTLDDPIAHQGFMAHWHWELQRWDPGPGFDWPRVFHALGNEHNSFPIELEKGKNIRSLLEPAKVKAYAEDYYKNNETQTHGWYPMGINQTWHGGIHLTAPRGTPVRAITDGVLVAAHFGRQATKLGSNNFVVLKHTIPIPAKKKGLDPKKFIFYSLYMHLDCIDTITLDDPEIPWLKDLTRIDKGKEEEEKKAEEEEEEKKPEEADEKEDGEGDEEGEEEEEEDEEEVLACDLVSSDLWLEVGVHTAALKRGMVAKIAYEEDPIYVLSGQVLGRVGMFGPEDEWRPQVHVEVFADSGWKEAIDIGVHGRFLIELDDDVGTNLFVENPDVTSLFGTPRRKGKTSLVPEKVLDQATIEDFWIEDTEYVEEKRYLRKLVTRHVSEWSDQVDWVASLSSSEDWDGKVLDFRKILKGTSIAKDAIATVLPFTWLSKDLAEHIGLDTKEWRGMLDHFHPIHFLMWLTYNSTQHVQTLSSSTRSPREVKRRAAQAEKEAERCRTAYKNRLEAQQKMDAGDKDAAKCFDHLTNEDLGESTVEISEFDEVPEVELMNEWMSSRDQGEWKQVLPDEEDF